MKSRKSSKAAAPKRGATRVVIAAGGTGGHIMPALALAEALSNIGRPVHVDFICGNRPVEREIYAAAGISPRVFPVAGMGGSGFLTRMLQYGALFYTFLCCLLMVRRYDVVVGMGSYITAPVLKAAALCRVPFVLHEQNSVLGRVNRAMAFRARAIACGLPLVDKPPKTDPAIIQDTGTPVRIGIMSADRAEAADSMYLSPDAFTLFVYGGSLGAQPLNALMAEALGILSSKWKLDTPLQVVWATGARNLESVRQLLKDQPIRGQLFLAPTIDRMDQALAMSDLAVSRAGASWLAEASLCGVPAILVPLPHAVGDHQRHNARVFEKADAAFILEQADSSAEELADHIAELASDTKLRERMARNMRRLSRPDAARDVALLVVEAATTPPPHKRRT